MENYKDPPVTLTIRNIDDSLKSCVLIHFMSCRQVKSLREDTEVVPFTYHLNGHFIEFGREEFCLITGLRFGPENSDHYVECINPFRRLLFGSDIDGGHITGQMLLDKINGEVFDKVQDKDVVAVCQLGVLHLVWDNCIFLFSTMATNPNDVRLSVLMALQEVHDEKACLEEQILSLMHCFDDRFTNHKPEINRLMTLPDHPLIEYGRYTLGCMTETDMKKATYLKMVTDELLKSMKEKRQLIKKTPVC
ncbi:hypothetical protein Tco_0820019 [Tanacetum coccineum]|uniref:Uncharacterized protein n=1 Tax=Tanacetum coccineum TaxID=301880 RepID=A0ABQ5A866_9ASTR